jgi:hypothetical protein
MSYRFTNTDKWNDAWFSNLKPNEKLLFIYLYENCDSAGFIELNQKRWSIDIGVTQSTIEGALKGLGRGLIISESRDCIFLRNYLKHQKNLPLIPEKNPAHRGIIKRFETYKFKFNIENIDDFIQGACKGLGSPLGKGKGNGSGNNGGEGGNLITWRESFDVYLKECKEGYRVFMENPENLKTQQRLNPNVNIKLSIEKGFINFWGTEAGWTYKKKSRSKEINWHSTIVNSISLNKVYYTKEEIKYTSNTVPQFSTGGGR